MFLNYLKILFVKRTLKKSLHNLNYNTLYNTIKTVGLIIDSNCCIQKEVLINELVANGIAPDAIKVIVYQNKLALKKGNIDPVFNEKQLNWKSENTDVAVVEFIKTEFDLLINYYNIEKIALILVTMQSKAKFKVGFSTIDNRLNHLLINTTADNHRIFMHELFRYLKILNKI